MSGGPQCPQIPEGSVKAKLQERAGFIREWEHRKARKNFNLGQDNSQGPSGAERVGEGVGSVASPQAPSAMRTPVLPDQLDMLSKCLIYSCTQGTSGLAQICRLCRVRKLWNKKEKEEKLSQQAERSPAPSLPSLSFPTSLSAGCGPLTQGRTPPLSVAPQGVHEDPTTSSHYLPGGQAQEVPRLPPLPS